MESKMEKKFIMGYVFKEGDEVKFWELHEANKIGEIFTLTAIAVGSYVIIDETINYAQMINRKYSLTSKFKTFTNNTKLKIKNIFKKEKRA